MAESFFSFKSFKTELIILLFFVLLLNNFVGKTITGDGVGYYEYLPSLFIHHDINRKDISEQSKNDFFKRVKKYGVYVDYEEHILNKYPCGVAVLQSPFFLVTKLFTKMNGNHDDGYQEPFHAAIFYAAIFYLFITLLLLKGLLNYYKLNNKSITLIQVLLVFSTSVTQYASSNSAFSHVYSLFAITAFLFFAKRFFVTIDVSNFLWACVVLGLIIILRQINILIFLFLPFIAGSWYSLKNGVRTVVLKPHILISGILLFSGVVFIQLFLWYLQTGHFFVYSYQGEGFNFLHPEFLNILFSYRKGLFIYTPVLLLCVPSLVWLVYSGKYYLAFSWLSFFVILTYVLSSWWSWYYGGSYGLRAYIEYYPVFLVLIGMFLANTRAWIKTAVIVFALITIPINLIQTYQYKVYILHATDMDITRYWKIFLNTNKRLKGIFYKKMHDYRAFNVEFEKIIGDLKLDANNMAQIWEQNCGNLPDINQIDFVKISFTNAFKYRDKVRIVLSINGEDKKNYYYHRVWHIHFANEKFSQFQTGSYDFILPKIENLNNKTIRLNIEDVDKDQELGDFKIQFLTKK